MEAGADAAEGAEGTEEAEGAEGAEGADAAELAEGWDKLLASRFDDFFLMLRLSEEMAGR